jgi:hypothetical protein
MFLPTSLVDELANDLADDRHQLYSGVIGPFLRPASNRSVTTGACAASGARAQSLGSSFAWGCFAGFVVVLDLFSFGAILGS